LVLTQKGAEPGNESPCASLPTCVNTDLPSN